MFKMIVSIIIVLVLSIVAPVYAYADETENKLIKACEDYYSENSERTWCIISEIYAYKKVITIIISIKNDEDSERQEVMSILLNQWYIPEYDTFDFMQIHLDYENYKENCQ